MDNLGYDNGENGYCEGATLFDQKMSASDGLVRDVADAERQDLAHIVENSCMSCNKLLGNREIKVVPPRYVQERDRYVKSGAVLRRIMCVDCYNIMKTVTKSRIRYRDTAAARRKFLIRSVINNILLKQ